MTTNGVLVLSDRDLITETTHAAAGERRATAVLIALLGELDARKFYLGEGCSPRS